MKVRATDIKKGEGLAEEELSLMDNNLVPRACDPREGT
jgi:hypothetical protein